MIFILIVATWFFRDQIQHGIKPLSCMFADSLVEANILAQYMSSVFVGVSLITLATFVYSDVIGYFGLLLIVWSLWIAMTDILELQWKKGEQRKVNDFRQTLPHNR